MEKRRPEETHLDKGALALGVDPAELHNHNPRTISFPPSQVRIVETHSVRSISIKMMRDRRRMVGEQHQPGMLTLGDVGEEVEPPVVVQQEALGFPLLRPDVVGSLEGVSLGGETGSGGEQSLREKSSCSKNVRRRRRGSSIRPDHSFRPRCRTW